MSIALERRLRLLEGRVAELERRRAPDAAPDPGTETAGPGGRQTSTPTSTVSPKRRSNPKNDRIAR